MNLLARLSLWMGEMGAEVGDIDSELLEQFVLVEHSRDFVCVTAKHSMGTMRRFLTACGYLRVAKVDGTGFRRPRPKRRSGVRECATSAV